MLKYEHREYNITESDIIEGKYDMKELLDILWYGINVYDGEEPYEKDAKRLTPAQRGISAVMWYDLEVSDGGHYKFFNESSGIVWKDAIGGLRLIEAYNCANILQSAIEKFNDSDNLFTESFEEEDKAYLAHCSDLKELIEKYIKKNPSEFVFCGEVDIPINKE